MKFFYYLIYLFHKLQKKGRFSAVSNSVLHSTSKIESGTSFIGSSLGRYSFCGYDCDVFMTDIGSFCSIANGVIIGGSAHPIDWVSTSPVFYDNMDSVKKKFSRYNRVAPKKTIVNHDVWIGRNAIIKQGVSIGVGAVIGMGSVVTKDVEPYSIVAGNPAKKIKMRFDESTVQRLLKSQWWKYSDEKIDILAVNIKEPGAFLKKLESGL